MVMKTKIKLFHKGYISKIYLIGYMNKKFLKKYFIKRTNSTVYKNINIENIFENEIRRIIFLNSVNVKDIITPRIININRARLWYSQEYYDLIPFNTYMILNSNLFFTNKNIFHLFEQLGRYLAKLHNNPKGMIHGDLNRKNMLFIKDKIFICDPSSLDNQMYNKPYLDLFRVINNIYSYNLFVRVLICNKDKIILSFLRGYFSGANIKLNKDILKKRLIEHINEIDVLMSKGLIGYIKFYIIHILNKLFTYNIKNNKYGWLNEI